MNRNNLPNFNEIDTNQILPELNHLIDTARSSLRDTLKRKSFTYNSLIALRERLRMISTNFGHLYRSYKRSVTKRRSGKFTLRFIGDHRVTDRDGSRLRTSSRL